MRITTAQTPPERDAWDVEYTCDEDPPGPWNTGRGPATTVAKMQDGALLIADRGTEPGSYRYYSYPWSADPEALCVAEVRAKVISGRSTIIVCSGRSEEEVRLYPDRVEAHYAGVSAPFDTTDGFHLYRCEIEGDDLRVFVDGELLVDASGKFTFPAHSNRNAIMFGAGSSPTTGEALWESIRFRTGAVSVYDVVLSVKYEGG